MKPKTKIQKEVQPLISALPLLNRGQVEYIKEHTFPHLIHRTKTTSTCMTCGHQWQGGMNQLHPQTCPNCGRKLKAMRESGKYTQTERTNVGQITTFNNFQVFRVFDVIRKVKRKELPKWHIEEVVRHYVRDDGKVVVCAIKHNPMGYGWHGPQWSTGSKMEIRKPMDKYYLWPTLYLPPRKVLKKIRRNGFKTGYHKMHPSYLFELLLSYPKAETLLKAKQYSLFQELPKTGGQAKIERFWRSIKIAIRHNYKVKNGSDWFDHLAEMEYLGMDVLNPTLICPANFEQEHQRVVERANRLRAKHRYEKEKEALEQAEIAYREAKEKLLRLRFEKGQIAVRPLQSVAEFYEEGEVMHHCVTRYHSNEDSLILTARVKGKRAETVEVSLSEFKVEQSRGKCNEMTKHHNNIVALVEQNMDEIRKAVKTNTAYSKS